jgi:hypothetical protein
MIVVLRIIGNATVARLLADQLQVARCRLQGNISKAQNKLREAKPSAALVTWNPVTQCYKNKTRNSPLKIVFITNTNKYQKT